MSCDLLSRFFNIETGKLSNDGFWLSFQFEC